MNAFEITNDAVVVFFGITLTIREVISYEGRSAHVVFTNGEEAYVSIRDIRIG